MEVALNCTEDSPDDRFNMKDVVDSSMVIAEFKASATASISHGLTLIVSLKEGEQPINSDITSMLVRGQSILTPIASSSWGVPCLQTTYLYGTKFMPSLTAFTMQHSATA
ncbi:hypothetical protein RJ640_027910 [Escallonia rubra]|uniref:Uncharacterized protein n=1 Tax=Escallonia rubra TaxID=112253 RepID=A0AA88UW47_9ASTE|nr:hypothetical protein RJ640_027910 [Escallonia rubra]